MCVQVYFVMLNFLLAIIVDAFSEVKEQTQEGAHVPIELLHLFKDKWQSLRNALNSKYISDSKVGGIDIRCVSLSNSSQRKLYPS
jgi:hypothetical protein